MTAVLRMPDIQQRLLAMEAEPAPCTPAELDALVAREIPKIAELARKAGITPQ
jgi:tripartite-type tricarboxylate transporter receptor subunit TctC